MSLRCLRAILPALLLGLALPSPAQTPVSGTYSFAVKDPVHKGGPSGVEDYLKLPNGQTARLNVDPELLVAAGGRRALAGSAVQVTTQNSNAARSRGGLRLNVSDVKSGVKNGVSASGIGNKFSRLGSLPYVTLLCKFKDVSTTPHDKSWYEGLLLNSAVSVNNFYKENSRDQMNINGSAVYGWLTLPGNELDYVTNPTAAIGDREMDADKLLTDASTLFNSQVNFPSYYGINIVLNKEFVYYDLGGYGNPLTIDGQSKTYGVTWLPIVDHEFITHEMGHSLGLDHSSGPYGDTYDSNWDMMSGDIYNGEDTYGAIGMHTNSYHKDVVGWIPESRIFTPAINTRTTITIQRTCQPGTGDYLMAQIPIPGSTTKYYTVEARRFVGFDYNEGKYAFRANGDRVVCGVPREGIVLHKVDTTRDFVDHASVVVDGDGNGDVNDDGAAWVVGETFSNADQQISVKVVSAGTSSYVVTIVRGTPATSSYDLTGRVFRNVPLTSGLSHNPNDEPGVARQGITGVTVTLSGPASRTITVDSSGNYSFSDLPAGTYTVTPSKTDFGFEPASRSVVLPATSGDYVPNGRANFRVYTVTAKVTRNSGAALSGVSVRLTRTSPALSRTVATDSSGVAFFNGLPAGTYTVTITPPTGFTFPKTTKTVTLPTTGTTGVSPNAAPNFTANANAKSGGDS